MDINGDEIFAPSAYVCPPPPVRFKWVHTINIFLCLLTLGAITAVTGTTIEDLSHMYGVVDSQMEQIVVTRSAGILVGSLLCGGFLYHRLNTKLVMIATLILGGLGTAVVPELAPYLWMAHVGMFVTGFSSGALETGANVWLVQLWDKDVNPIMQTYHLSFGTGSLIAPLVAEQFLSPEAANQTDDSSPTFPTYFSGLNLLSSNNTNNTVSHIEVPYAMFGGGYVIMGLVLLVYFFRDRTTLKQEEEETQAVNRSLRARFINFEWLIVGLLGLFIVVDVSVETCMSQMMSIYITNHKFLGISKSEISYLTALFWFTYTMGRLVAIICSVRVSPHRILVFCQSVAVLGCFFIFLVAIFPNFGRPAIWIGMGITGLGLAPLYGTAFTWAVSYIHLKFTHMAIILVFACSGMGLPPLIIAPFVKSSDVFFPICTFAFTLVQASILGVMLFTTKGRPMIYDEPIPQSDSVENFLPRGTDHVGRL